MNLFDVLMEMKDVYIYIYIYIYIRWKICFYSVKLEKENKGNKFHKFIWL